MPSKETAQALKRALSYERMSTYEIAVKAYAGTNINIDDAILALYEWNCKVSGTLLAPLQICEVVIRNAVSMAIADRYGDNWPNTGFKAQLPRPRKYELEQSAENNNNTNMVITDMKFIFWQQMFTSRYDKLIWNNCLRIALPNTDPQKSIAELREEIYRDLDYIRNIRNRIAHHEPIIFERNRNKIKIREDLDNVLDKIRKVIALKCTSTSEWMMNSQNFLTTIATNPLSSEILGKP